MAAYMIEPDEPQTWTEKCSGCKHEFPVTKTTRWNQCPRCEGFFCHRCVTSDTGHCFACATELWPQSAPCSNCRKVTPELEMEQVGDEGASEYLCLKCYFSMSLQHASRGLASKSLVEYQNEVRLVLDEMIRKMQASPVSLEVF